MAHDGSFYCFGKIVMPPQTSIHPRVRGGRTVHAKANTSKKANPATKLRAIAGLTGHVERHPNDAMSIAHLSALKSTIAKAVSP